MNTAYQELKELFGEKIRENEILSKYTTYKVGGPSDLFFDAKNKEDLVRIITESKKRHIPTFVLGGGTNILISDTGFRGLVVKNSTNRVAVTGLTGKVISGKRNDIVYVEADSGTPINYLERFTLDEGLEGMEMHLGLPGSVGGAVYMNSKWTKPPGSVGDVLSKATIIDAKGDVRMVDHGYFQFSYGHSSLQKNKDILISVVFALKRTDKDELWARANQSISYRKETQPQGVSTAGCVFKNISKAESIIHNTPNSQTSAGYLLDNAGLKSMKVGGAEVSPLHANFFITHPGATACDMVQLIEIARKRVREIYGVDLKEEIERLGDFSTC